MEVRLCPKCGAYWRCDCQLEELMPVPTEACRHDWTEAIGVDLDTDLAGPERRVLVCRLCGLYAIREPA